MEGVVDDHEGGDQDGKGEGWGKGGITGVFE